MLKSGRVAFLALLVFVACLAYSRARPDGAPKEACSTLTPKHGSQKPQTSASPYRFRATKSGNQVTVTISSTSPGKEFKGFIIAAEDSTGKRIFGQFVTNANVKGLDCDSKPNSAATHVNNSPKKSINLQWKPLTYKGRVTFRGAVVEDKKKFWNNIRSSSLTI